MEIRDTSFAGLKAIELLHGEMKLVVVTEFGPRIAFVGAPDGENLLYWEPHNLHRDDWQLHGGHRLWITRPGADEGEETYRPDNSSVKVAEEDGALRLTQAVDPANRMQRMITIRPCGAGIDVDHAMRNTGDMLYSGGLWALTCTLPREGTRYGTPLGDGSSWDAAAIVAFRHWAGHGCDSYNDPQFSCAKDMFLLDPQGIENKRMIQSRRGIVAMADPARGLTFAKRMCYEPAASYPEATNIALYVGPDNFMVEMETMSPLRQLRPGESLHHVEQWVLRAGAADLTGAAEVLRLFS